MPKAKGDVTPAEVQRAKNMRDAGKGYKEIMKALDLASEKVAWHVVNSTGKPPGKASGKASRRPVAGGRAKTRPKAQKASGTPKASRRTPKKASPKAPAGNGSAPAGPSIGGGFQHAGTPDRPVARPTAEAGASTDTVRSVPKPKDRKK